MVFGAMEGVSEAYHIPFSLRLKGDLADVALRHALDRIVIRHEALRTTFVLIDDEPVQKIASAEQSRFHLIEQDLRGHSGAERGTRTAGDGRSWIRLRSGARSADPRPFDSAGGRRTRAADYDAPHRLRRLVDGCADQRTECAYTAFQDGGEDPLPELDIQYADYAVWQRQWIEGEILQQQASYWKATLAGAPSLLELPADRPASRRNRTLPGPLRNWRWTNS